MNVSELKKLLESVPDVYEVVIRCRDGDGFGGHPVYHSVPVSDWTVIEYETDPPILEFGLYPQRDVSIDESIDN